MKIIIATGIFPPDIGGPATYSEVLARELTKRDFEIAVISYADNQNSKLKVCPFGTSPEGRQNSKLQLKTQNYKVVRISRNYPKGVRHFLYFWKALRIAKGADMIYAQDLISAGLPALAAAKLLRKKFILKVVGDYAWENYQNRIKNQESRIENIEEFQKDKFDVKTEVLRFLERMVARRADLVITPSEYLKRLVLGWGVSKMNVRVVYNAYYSEDLQATSYPATRDLAKRDKLQAVNDIIISVGRLVPWKGFSALIEIMPDLLKENPNFKLLIVGEGPLEKDLRFKIEDLRLKDKVILTGKLPHGELMAYLREAKMFVLNTAYEGLSHQLLEALAAGAPVITTNVCGNPEVITDGENGILVGFDDKAALKEAISRVWKDGALAEKFIQNGKKTLSKFTLEKMIEETINALKS